MRIYLAGPIEQTDDGGISVREELRAALTGIEGVELIDPVDFNQNFKTLRDLVKTDKKWKEKIRYIIDKDLEIIEQVDLIVAYISKPASFGTSTEVVLAHHYKTPTICYLPHYSQGELATALHPWLLCSIDTICANSAELRRAVEEHKEASQ